MSKLLNIKEKDFKSFLNHISTKYNIQFYDGQFDGAWVKELFSADLTYENKEKDKKGKTSHIAVTSEPMQLFPVNKEFKRKDSSWKLLEIDLINKKINRNFRFTEIVNGAVSFREAFDKTGKHQVYLSKKQYDSSEFTNLRNTLHTGDQIWFLKYSGEFKYLVFAIDKSLVETDGLEKRFFYIKNQDNTNYRSINLVRLLLSKIKKSQGIIDHTSYKEFFKNHCIENKIPYYENNFNNLIEKLIYKGILSKVVKESEILYYYKDLNIEEYLGEASSQLPEQEGEYEGKIKPKYERLIEIKSKESRSKRLLTNTAVKQEALRLANYQCEFGVLINENHKTFLSRSSKLNYTEGHHLVRVCDQGDISFKREDKYISLDQVENVVSLCPNCHAKIHFGSEEEIITMLTLLYENRRKRLESCDIYITLEKLIEFYIS